MGGIMKCTNGNGKKRAERKLSKGVLAVQKVSRAGCKCPREKRENRLDVLKQRVCAKINRSCNSSGFRKKRKSRKDK